MKRYIKPYIKPFIILMVIYSISMLSIWRSGISYNDDIGRAIYGNGWGRADFNRYSMSALLHILTMSNTNFLIDISPLPQILAMALLSISGIIVTYLFCNGTIKYLPLIMTAIIGLAPFNIECWLYKFEAPGFALSILVSVIPMLFWSALQDERRRKPYVLFFTVSTACLMLMWTTYQATCGVYIVMTAGLV